MTAPVDVLARRLFETYSKNSGNPPECHYNRHSAEQWMAQALEETGVAELIEWADSLSHACRSIPAFDQSDARERRKAQLIEARADSLRAAVARVQGGAL